MLAQAVVQHQGQVLFQPVQADGPEWDVHVVVRSFDDQPGRRFGEAHQGPQQPSAMARRLAWPIKSSAAVSWNPRAASPREYNSYDMIYGPWRGSVISYELFGSRWCRRLTRNRLDISWPSFVEDAKRAAWVSRASGMQVACQAVLPECRLPMMRRGILLLIFSMQGTRSKSA